MVEPAQLALAQVIAPWGNDGDDCNDGDGKAGGCYSGCELVWDGGLGLTCDSGGQGEHHTWQQGGSHLVSASELARSKQRRQTLWRDWDWFKCTGDGSFVQRARRSSEYTRPSASADSFIPSPDRPAGTSSTSSPPATPPRVAPSRTNKRGLEKHPKH